MERQAIYELYEKTLRKVIKKHPKYAKYLNRYRFYFGNKKTAFGSCHYKEKEIYIHLPLCSKESKKSVKDTILHEMAHALDFEINKVSSGHGSEWKKYARILGCKPKACKESEESKKRRKTSERPTKNIKKATTTNKIDNSKGIKTQDNDGDSCKYVLVYMNRNNRMELIDYRKKILNGTKLNTPLVSRYLIGRKQETLNRLMFITKETYIKMLTFQSISK